MDVVNGKCLGDVPGPIGHWYVLSFVPPLSLACCPFFPTLRSHPDLFSDFNFLRPGSMPAPRVPTPVHTPRPPHGPRSPRSVDTGMLGHSPRNASRSWFCVLPSRSAATSDMKEQVTVTGQHRAGTWSSGVRKVLSSPHFTEVARRVQAGGPGLA